MDKGVLYIASGSSYIKDAARSAESVKNNSNLPITLITDREIQNPVFDTVIQSDNFLYHYGDSVLQIPPLPYEKTLLLDTDTVVSDSFEELFTMLENVDIAVATIAEDRFKIQTVPDSFPEYNTGVVLFDRCEATSDFVDLWKEIYREYLDDGVRMNQPAFREALYKSPVRVGTIPTEYNCRANFGGYLTDKVKILHGNFDNTANILSKLNEYDTPRVFFNKDGKLHVIQVNTTNNRFSN